MTTEQPVAQTIILLYSSPHERAQHRLFLNGFYLCLLPMQITLHEQFYKPMGHGLVSTYGESYLTVKLCSNGISN